MVEGAGARLLGDRGGFFFQVCCMEGRPLVGLGSGWFFAALTAGVS